MTEYICGAVMDGYALKSRIPEITGEVILCDGLRCLEQYRKIIHVDGEEKSVCRVDGKIPAKDSPSSLPERLKVSFK